MNSDFATLGIGDDQTLYFSEAVDHHRCDRSDELPAFLDHIQAISEQQPVTFALSYEGAGAHVLGQSYRAPWRWPVYGATSKRSANRPCLIG